MNLKALPSLILLLVTVWLMQCSNEKVAGTTNTGNALIEVAVPGDAASMAGNSIMKEIVITGGNDQLVFDFNPKKESTGEKVV